MSVQVKLKAIPHVKGLPFFGNMFDFANANFLPFLERHTKQLGEIFSFRVANQKMIVINDADLARHMLTDNWRNYSKRLKLYKTVHQFTGNGLITNQDYDSWFAHRKMMQPAFHKNELNGFVDIYLSNAEMIISKWKATTNETIIVEDILTEMNGLTLRIVLQSLFSTSLTEDQLLSVSGLMQSALEEISQRSRKPIPLYQALRLKAKSEFEKNSSEIRSIILDMISQRRQKKTCSTSDLLDMLIDARDAETGQGMSDEEVLFEALTIISAGQETTAVSMTWILLQLAKYPGYQELIRRESYEAYSTGSIDASLYRKLDQCKAFINETLRLYPPISVIPRRVVANDNIKGYALPANDTVLIAIHLLHQNEQYWNNPTDFVPERFINKTDPSHDWAYIPFLGGPRMCIGQSFAMLEMAFLCIQLCHSFQFELADIETDIPIDVVVSSRPAKPINLKLTSLHN